MTGSRPHTELSASDLAKTFLRTPMTLHSRENVQLVAQTLLDLEEQLEAADERETRHLELITDMTTLLDWIDRECERLEEYHTGFKWIRRRVESQKEASFPASRPT